MIQTNKKRVLIYTMKDCGHCSILKDRLNKSGISFVNKDIDIYKEDYENISKVLDTDYLPIALCSGKWIVPEKDFNTIDECVDLIKKCLN